MSSQFYSEWRASDFNKLANWASAVSGWCPVQCCWPVFLPLRYALSRYQYAVASRMVFSAALHSAIDVVGISGNDRDNRVWARTGDRDRPAALR